MLFFVACCHANERLHCARGLGKKQHTTKSNTLQHTATPCNKHCSTHRNTHCNTLQHTLQRALQHALQHTNLYSLESSLHIESSRIQLRRRRAARQIARVQSSFTKEPYTLLDLFLQKSTHLHTQTSRTQRMRTRVAKSRMPHTSLSLACHKHLSNPIADH